MAVKHVDTSTVAASWNKRMRFPKDNYIIRCIEESIGVNKNGNFMVTLGWEIVNQKPVKIGDRTVELDGVKFTSYHVIKVNNGEDEAENVKKSDKAFSGYQDRILVPCGIDVSEGWDDENPPSVKGKVVWATLYGQEQAARKEPTPEQKAKKEMGDILKDPLTGDDLIAYQPTIETIFGVFDGEVERPF